MILLFFIDYRRRFDGEVLLESDVVERSVPSSLKRSSNGKSFFVGELFECSESDFFSSQWEEEPDRLNEGCSALYAVTYDEKSCVFAADISGRELLFYYHTNDRLVLSDSLWGVLKRIQPGFEGVDKDSLAESIVMGGGFPCDHSTPVKNLKWLGANCIGRFDARSWALDVHSYGDIRRSGDIVDVDEAVEQFDAAMRHMACCLGERHPDAVFGLGLSGGLDSRTALHYLSDAGLELECFNVGKARPHGVLLASSLKRAHELANTSRTNYCNVEWQPHSIRSKMDLMLENQPLGTGGHYTNAYKYESEGRPRFDVLVGGGQAIGPMLVGVSAFNHSDKMSVDDLCAYLLHLAIGEVRAYAYTENSFRKQMRQLGASGVDIEGGKNREQWDAIVGKGAYGRTARKVRSFVEDCALRGYRPADITLDYRTRALGPTGRNGAYESGLGTEKSYTIYTPFLIRDALRWDAPLVEERRVLKELIAAKMPEYTEIGEEMFGSTKVNQSNLSLFAQKAAFMMRGSGIMTDDWYSRHPAIRKAFLEDMTSPYKWFYELFPSAQDYEGIWNMSPSRMNSLWEAKRVVDCMESKRYLEFE